MEKTNGQMLCIACPGSGKTTVIIERVRHMLESGISPGNILVITFTKEAALQMQGRFEKKYGKTGVYFGTIHALCFQVLKRARKYNSSNVLSSSETWGFFNSLLYKKVQTDNFEEFVKNLISEISFVRNSGADPGEYKPEHSKKEVFLQAFNAYMEFKEQNRKIDYDDMLWICRDIFRSNADELRFWRGKYRYIMIDEFQDTNQLQAEIFYLLAGDNGNICVVGDDDQSVYRFRAADTRVFLDFPKQYPQAEKFYLSTNYRSGTDIIKRAGLLIGNNKTRFGKKFLAGRQDAGGISMYASKPGKEDESILGMVASLHQSGVDYNDIAVLYRINAQNQLLAGLFMQHNIPFYCTEPPRDYHQEFIFQDIMAYYRLANSIQKPGDVQRILNRPNRYLKVSTFKHCRYDRQELLDACRKMDTRSGQCMGQIFTMLEDIKRLADKTPEAFVDYLEHRMGYGEFITDYCAWCQKDPESSRALLATLKKEAKQFSSMQEWEGYAQFYARQLEQVRADSRKEGVCLSTLHAAKGLEWDNVIIKDAVEGICPYKKARTPEDYEEERRLFYVGITRAKDRCAIFTSKENPSRYLAEMGAVIAPDKKKEGSH